MPAHLQPFMHTALLWHFAGPSLPKNIAGDTPMHASHKLAIWALQLLVLQCAFLRSHDFSYAHVHGLTGLSRLSTSISVVGCVVAQFRAARIARAEAQFRPSHRGELAIRIPLRQRSTAYRLAVFKRCGSALLDK
eukprot:6212850-Pleurochrysis_carterae.AAC.6